VRGCRTLSVVAAARAARRGERKCVYVCAPRTPRHACCGGVARRYTLQRYVQRVRCSPRVRQCYASAAVSVHGAHTVLACHSRWYMPKRGVYSTPMARVATAWQRMSAVPQANQRMSPRARCSLRQPRDTVTADAFCRHFQRYAIFHIPYDDAALIRRQISLMPPLML